MGLDQPGHLYFYPMVMGTLGQLVDVVAAVEGIDPERVTAIARAVREAGLISTGGRGPSAAQMTERDAANLLIAVNAADTARAAPETVTIYRALEAKRKKRTADFGSQFEQAILAARNNNIPEFVVGLIRDFGTARNLLGRRIFPYTSYAFRIEFEKPVPSLLVQISIPHSAIDHVYFERDQRGRERRSQNDRKERTTITHRTLIAVGAALRLAG